MSPEKLVIVAAAVVAAIFSLMVIDVWPHAVMAFFWFLIASAWIHLWK